MYTILKIKSNIRVPPTLFNKELKESIAAAINREFVGYIGKEGFFLTVTGIDNIGEGAIIPGDGAIYYETSFQMLVYRPILQELVIGVVSEITEFGTFLRIGPVDGLVHVSQVMDDYVSYSDSGTLSGKESKKVLKVKDKVIARIIAVSLKSLKGAKIGLTMRQPGLGKIEWLEAEKRKSEQPEVVEEKKPAAGKKSKKTKKK